MMNSLPLAMTGVDCPGKSASQSGFLGSTLSGRLFSAEKPFCCGPPRASPAATGDAAMQTLLKHEGISQRQLTSLMSSDPNTVAALLERMEKAGLIERQTHERDHRANRLRLKPRGQTRYETARKIAVTLQGEILSALP